MAWWASRQPVVLNVQHDPHDPCPPPRGAQRRVSCTVVQRLSNLALDRRDDALLAPVDVLSILDDGVRVAEGASRGLELLAHFVAVSKLRHLELLVREVGERREAERVRVALRVLRLDVREVVLEDAEPSIKLGVGLVWCVPRVVSPCTL